MAEEFFGVKPLHEPIKPDQQRLENAPPVIDPSDIAPMDDAYKAMMAEKAKKEEEEAAAAKKAEEEAAAAKAAEDAKTEEEKEAERIAAEEAAAAEAAKTEEEKEAERKAAEEAAAAEAAKTEEEKEAERKAAEEAAAAAEAAKAAEEDPYKDVELPANARGKSAEAFATVKARAAADLAKRDEQIETLKTELEQTKARLTDPIPEDTKKEIEELRLFRAKLDLQADPEFTKKYDGQIDKLHEFIYAQIKDAVGDEGVKKIRELGGLDKVNYEDILGKIESPHVVRLVQGKLDEIAVLRFDKTRALEVAEGDIKKYVAERQEEYTKTLTAHHDATNTELETIFQNKMKWLHDTKIAETADAETRKLHEATQKFNEQVKQHMAVALQDDSPQMRAVLIAGMGELLHTKEQLKQSNAALAISEKARKEAEAKLAKIKKASVTRLDKSSAPPSGSIPKPKLDSPNMSAAEALDAHRKGQLERA
jgi:hypothetical protein